MHFLIPYVLKLWVFKAILFYKQKTINCLTIMLLLNGTAGVMPFITMLLSSSTVITYILYRKEQKRSLNAEAFSKEVEALKNIINAMQQQMQYYEGRVTEMQKLIIGKDTYITQISQDKHALEIKNAKKKSIINKAYSCRCRTDSYQCPVLLGAQKSYYRYRVLS